MIPKIIYLGSCGKNFIGFGQDLKYGLIFASLNFARAQFLAKKIAYSIIYVIYNNLYTYIYIYIYMYILYNII